MVLKVRTSWVCHMNGGPEGWDFPGVPQMVDLKVWISEVPTWIVDLKIGISLMLHLHDWPEGWYFPTVSLKLWTWRLEFSYCPTWMLGFPKCPTWTVDLKVCISLLSHLNGGPKVGISLVCHLNGEPEGWDFPCVPYEWRTWKLGFP